MFFAIRDGVKDAREGRPPHFWRMVTGPPEARKRLRWVYPIEAMTTAAFLAIVPYLVVRGVVNRIARRWIVPHGAAAR